MKVFGVFTNIVLLVTLLAERNPAHGLMRATGINATTSKVMHSFYHQRGYKGKWYKYKRFQKIFGGEEVKSIEDFPYMVFMTRWMHKQPRPSRCGVEKTTSIQQ